VGKALALRIEWKEMRIPGRLAATGSSRK